MDERLEIIKSRTVNTRNGYDYEITLMNTDDYKWLIETIEEQQKELNAWRNECMI